MADSDDDIGPLPPGLADAGGDGGDDDYEEYVPLKERRAREEAARAAKRARTTGGGADSSAAAAATGVAAGHDRTSVAGGAGASAAAPAGVKSALPSFELGAGREGVSLLDQARSAAAAAGGASAGVFSEEERRRRAEAELLAQVEQVQVPSLVSAKEHAQGIVYTEPLKTDWRPPRHIRERAPEAHDVLRKKWHILVEGTDVPPPIKTFADMRFPAPVLAALQARGIARPTPIQVQALPVALSGRDLIGIAFTGSGKTLVFTLPMVMFALQEELRQPLGKGEGPIGVIMAPSRELARQTFELATLFAEHLKQGGYPELRGMLAIGGEDMKKQMEPVNKGVHFIVATPGRLNDHLTKKRINFDLCRYIVLDEGDRMLDMGFDEEIKTAFSFFSRQRQTVIFSATMPKKIQDFARATLVAPVLVNVGRAGAANLDVIQEVEYVKQEAKVTYLLQVLQKTAPPVLVFAENKRDVDEVQEYLLLKGVSAVSIHGGKSQEERNEAMDAFKAGKADVLVATDVAAKGLDFPAIQHVVNFDMPKEIENYVHRIGRTGRAGKTGVATTFINKSVDEHLLLDLKHLLIEAKQRVPPVLLALEDPADLHSNDGELGAGCAYCGGLGHRITECPKLDHQRRQMAGPKRDVMKGSEW